MIIIIMGMIITVSSVATIFGYQKGWIEILATLTFPISLLKNIISVVQMVDAARNIAAVDVIQRGRSKDSG